MNEATAKIIVDAIIEDLSDRRGLKQEWHSIDKETQTEIKSDWAAIILKSSKTP